MSHPTWKSDEDALLLPYTSGKQLFMDEANTIAKQLGRSVQAVRVRLSCLRQHNGVAPQRGTQQTSKPQATHYSVSRLHIKPRACSLCNRQHTPSSPFLFTCSACKGKERDF